MPNRFLDSPGGVTSSGAVQTGNRFLRGEVEDASLPSPAVEGDSGFSTAGKVAGGAAALAGAAALTAKAARMPGMLGRIGKLAEGANAVRQQLMLSGMALPKSLLGNTGAALTSSIERGSMAPLREMFSLQTLKDAARAYKNPANAPRGVTLPGPVPGKVMGAFDEAAQGALRRGGLSAKEAEREVLQSPLGENFGPMGKYLENPAMQYLLPFRRTPFNQAIEGAKLAQDAYEGGVGARRLLMASMGGGAVHGAATADDSMPVSIPFATAAAGRAGAPYALGALMGRYWLGGSNTNGGIPSGMLPVSEYGIDQSIKDPLRPFTKPAAITALERIFGGS